tara:strand:- start:35104 stop:35592 length:489 start_codon:yes stop_codon:yes gene_type:complete
MENQIYTSKQYLTSLRVIHFALLLGQIIFAAITLLLGGDETNSQSGLDSNLIIAPVLIVSGILIGYFIEQNKLKNLDHRAPLKAKLDKYRTILITKYSLVEGAVLFSIVNYLLTSNFVFLIYALFGIAYMVFIGPSKRKLFVELKLSSDEQEKLNDSSYTFS